RNAGPSGATGLTVTDTLPPGIAVPAHALPAACTSSGRTVTCSPAQMDSGVRTDLTLAVIPTTAGALADTVTAKATEPDPNEANNTASVKVSVSSQAGGPAGSGDFNGDGTLDLAVADADSDTVHIWLNDGQGHFTDAQDVQLTDRHHGGGYGEDDATDVDFRDQGEHLPPSLAVGDFNGNGHLDIAVADWRTNAVDILTNDGTGHFTETAVVPLTGRDPVSITTGDFNGDGALDLAVASQASDDVSVLFNDTHGGFTEAAVIPLRLPPGVRGGDDRDARGPGRDEGRPACEQPAALTAGDFTGDGQPDLAVACEASDTVALLTNAGGAGFTLSVVPLSDGHGPTALTAGDFNGDGALDLAVANRESDNVAILLNSGTDASGQPAFSETVPATRVGRDPLALAAGDLNSDGAEDLVTANRDSGSVSVLLNGGAGQFPASLESEVPVGRQPIAVTAGDFNGDGQLDLVVIRQPDLTPLFLPGGAAPPAPGGDHHGDDGHRPDDSGEPKR
ncbi:MAG TPA: FG-GAP-like repeat-containing protein, partial [Vicinamibacterales bacterium]|nr:FG-GAP-like repeat-containing protein [Vicinamibacterales bacterium]